MTNSKKDSMDKKSPAANEGKSNNMMVLAGVFIFGLVFGSIFFQNLGENTVDLGPYATTPYAHYAGQAEWAPHEFEGFDISVSFPMLPARADLTLETNHGPTVAQLYMLHFDDLALALERLEFAKENLEDKSPDQIIESYIRWYMAYKNEGAIENLHSLPYTSHELEAKKDYVARKVTGTVHDDPFEGHFYHEKGSEIIYLVGTMAGDQKSLAAYKDVIARFLASKSLKG